MLTEEEDELSFQVYLELNRMHTKPKIGRTKSKSNYQRKSLKEVLPNPMYKNNVMIKACKRE